MLNKNVETFLGCDADYADAQIVLFGAPFDSTTSFRPGTRFGPAAIRRESYGLELYSPYQDKELTDRAVLDAGDIELPVRRPRPRARGDRRARGGHSRGRQTPLSCWAENTSSRSAACARRLANSATCTSCTLTRTQTCATITSAPSSHTPASCAAATSWSATERSFNSASARATNRNLIWGREHVFTHKFDLNGLETALARLRGRPVYLTVDLDVLDPSVFPGTGTPEPGGVTFDALRARPHGGLQRAARRRGGRQRTLPPLRPDAAHRRPSPARSCANCSSASARSDKALGRPDADNAQSI